MIKKILLAVFTITLSQWMFAQKPTFKVIAYCTPSAVIDSIPFQYLTHINYAFAIPAKSGDSLEPILNVDYVKELIEKSHKQNVKVFLSIGGWGIGDGGGEDGRFHRMAETENGQNQFINSSLNMIEKLGFDGIDLDWEYPDPPKILQLCVRN
jgi:chitinase